MVIEGKARHIIVSSVFTIDNQMSNAIKNSVFQIQLSYKE